MRNRVAIVGTGFVADLYMRSLRTLPQITITKAFDIDSKRLNAFCGYWRVGVAKSLDEVLNDRDNPPDLILNLTNPNAHYEVSLAGLESNRHVYSEKPLATNMSDARKLYESAKHRQLLLASAPCSVLGEAAQTVWAALRRNDIGVPRLVYAELDDDFIFSSALCRLA